MHRLALVDTQAGYGSARAMSIDLVRPGAYQCGKCETPHWVDVWVAPGADERQRAIAAQRALERHQQRMHWVPPAERHLSPAEIAVLQAIRRRVLCEAMRTPRHQP